MWEKMDKVIFRQKPFFHPSTAVQNKKKSIIFISFHSFVLISSITNISNIFCFEFCFLIKLLISRKISKSYVHHFTPILSIYYYFSINTISMQLLSLSESVNKYWIFSSEFFVKFIEFIPSKNGKIKENSFF